MMLMCAKQESPRIGGLDQEAEAVEQETNQVGIKERKK